MNITIKDLQNSIHSAFSFDPLPRKIKLTSKAYAFLETISKPVFQEISQEEYVKMYTSTGAIGRWDGIPIEIDDTIESEYYEIIYEENKL